MFIVTHVVLNQHPVPHLELRHNFLSEYQFSFVGYVMSTNAAQTV